MPVGRCVGAAGGRLARSRGQPGRKLCVPYDALRDVIAIPGREWALTMQRGTTGVVITAEAVE